MSFAFSGPSLFPVFSCLGGAMIGGLYSVIAKTNSMPILIFTIRGLADGILYHLAITLLHSPSDSDRAKIYAITNLTLNIATLLVLRRMELIGKVGTQIFVALMVMEIMCKCTNFSKYRVENIK